MKTSRILAMILATIMTLMLFTGCEKTTNASTEATATITGSPLMDSIIDAGVIKVGVGTGGAPMGFTDDKGNPAGYDIDWAKKLAEALGVDVEFVIVNGETRIPALTSGRIDLMMCNTTGNVERAKTIDFTIPYVVTGLKVMVREDSEYYDLESMNKPECKIAINRGGTMDSLLDQYAPLAERVYTTTFSEQLLLVEQGKADATMEDATVIDYAASNSDGELVSTVQYTSDPLCWGVRKGDLEFVRWLDMFISWQITQGFQKELYNKWWGCDPAVELKTLW